MTVKKHFLFLLIVSQLVVAQIDNGIKLKEVVISDLHLKNASTTQSVLKLNDSVIKKSQNTLTQLLNFNTSIYFKEYGLGMTSNVSFRGTTSSQTAVIWNGININSQLNGSTDFNTVSPQSFTSIAVKPGGGSVIYGSGAIGGTLHLNNDLNFKKQFFNELNLRYGNFETYSTSYKIVASDTKWTSEIGFSRNSSKNDFPYLNTNLKNSNGNYFNTSINSNLGYKINFGTILKLYSQLYDGERHYSLTSPNATKTKYQDFNTRNLLELENSNRFFVSRFKFAHLLESYKYFSNLNSNGYSFGKVESIIAKCDFGFDINSKMKINSIIEFSQNKGYGSRIIFAKRQTGSASILWKHLVTRRCEYYTSIRKEFSNSNNSPILFSFGTSLELSKYNRIKLNASKNFRLPTYNDLYWEGSGNPNLKPEIAQQFEIGNEFFTNNFSVSFTSYYTLVKDLLRWVPSSIGADSWSPENTESARMYGNEVLLRWKKTFQEHTFSVNGTYAHTISESEQTDPKGKLIYKQLIYVPFDKLTASFSYNFKKATTYFQYLYNGKVFTTPLNNLEMVVNPYWVANAGIDYDFGNKNTYKIGFEALNIWNQNYESVTNRPMPGRNFTMYLTLNF
jgi:outer membrane cobalamin receptor